MKRDLQIAKEIQAWLLPARPPQVPGWRSRLQRGRRTLWQATTMMCFRGVGATAQPTTQRERLFDRRGRCGGQKRSGGDADGNDSGEPEDAVHDAGSLTELVARMNRYACSNSQNGRRFTTAFLAEYEPESRVLHYVNAGHNAPVSAAAVRNNGRIARGRASAGRNGKCHVRERHRDA